MKLLLLFFFITFSVSSIAQEIKDPKTPIDSTKKPKPETLLATTTNLETFLPQITPKSPNISGIERHGNYPVSMFTGVPNIEIPIIDVTAGGLKFPIKFLYHAAGNKVTDAANFVGLNWTLIYGASVTRQVKGLADEINAGSLGKTIPLDVQASLGANCYNEDVRSTLQYMAENNIDTERDIFSLNSPQISNQFILRDLTDYQWLTNNFSKITFSKTPSSFQIKDEKGYRYLYDETEVTIGAGITTWLIKKAQGSRPNDKIVFEYYPVSSYSRTHEIIETITINDNGTGNVPMGSLTTGSLPGSNFISNSSDVEQKLPKTIYFPNGKVEFVLEANDREDGLGKALDKIEIYSYNDNNQSYSKVKIFDMVYEYKLRQDNSKVLFLKEVVMQDNGEVEIGKYQLEYNTTYSLPGFQSKSKDYWGYYNGANNSTLIPNQTIARSIGGNSSTLTVTGGNRESSEEHMKAWILNKITFPTGGTTEFEYEANRYLEGATSKIVGGLRIKQMKSLSAIGATPIIKYYKYGFDETGNGRLRDNISLQYQTKQKILYYNIGLPPTLEYTYDSRTYSSNNNSTLFPNEGSPVTYTHVTEYEDAGVGDNGKAIYEFRDASDTKIQLINGAKYFVNSRHWDRGQLINKQVFGADNKLKYWQKNNYSTIDNNETPELGGRLIQGQNIYLNSRPYDLRGSGCYGNNDDFYPNQTYHIAFGITKQISSVEYFYNDADDTKFVEKKMEFDYNSYYQPTETRTFNSDGDVRISKSRYITDFNNLNTYGLTNNALAYSNMLANNEIATPIEVLNLRKYTDNSIRVIDGSLTKYKTFTFDSHDFTLPENISILGIPENPGLLIGNFTFADVAADKSIINDSRYAQRINFTDYDSNGNLTGYNVDNGAKTAFTYSTTNLNGVYHSFPTSEIQNSGETPSLTTSFNFKYPLLGLESITAPNGLKTYFEFDTFGRFKLAKDHEENLINLNQYFIGANTNIKSSIFRVPTTAEANANDNTKANISINYFDGLGREIQKIAYKASPLGNDIASGATTYDFVGRPKLSYLPFPTTLSTGGYQSDIQAKAKDFYGNDDYPYNETNYEASPLNRSNEQIGPGGALRNPDKSIKVAYEMAGDNIPLYKISGTTIAYNSNAKYPANSLFKTIKTDEENHNTVEIKDIEGKLIQKQVQGPTGYMTTHYVYNDLKQLKAVIQPEAYPLTADLAETSDTYKGNVFFYKYDNRGRVISKKVPAADEEYMVYDRWDRLVLSQTALQRLDNNRWSFYKYDALNREIYRGDKEYGGTSDPTTLQANAMASTTIGESRTAANPFYDGNGFPDNASTYLAQINFYDNYNDWKNTELNFVTGETPHTPITNTTGLLTGAYVRNLIDNDWLKMANYFDNKNRLIQSTKTNHLSGANADVMSTEYNFAGEPLVQKTIHKKTGKPDLSEKTILAYDHVGRTTQVMHFINDKAQNIAVYEHDEIGRQKTKKINAISYAETKKAGVWADPAVWKGSSIPIWNNTVKINHNITIPLNYKAFGGSLELGSPSNLNMLAGSIINLNGESNNYPYLQKIDYDYHIRGGLLGINLDNGNVSTDLENDLFSFKLDYGLDGNIGKQTWKHKTSSEERSYTYGYDPASRLNQATYSPSGTYNISNTYDNNGNLLTMNRNGVDQLTYNYEAGRLKYVNDGIIGNADVGDFRNNNTAADDYEYKEDGSLNKDRNKGIDNINYITFLKKIRQINFTDGKWIKFDYDGAGNLLKRSNSDGENYDYSGSIIYKGGEYYQINTAEGRGIYNGSNWEYEYNFQDIWGNLRHTFKNENGFATTKQISDFDPWGWEFNKVELAKKNNFKYQKQERVDDFGLGIDLFKYRPSDYQIGRFWAVDPLASDYSHNSVYAFQENKFGLGVELEGKEMVVFDAINWFIGGYVKYIQGGVDYAKNEVQHNSDNSYTQNTPQKIQEYNYTTNKINATAKIIEGGTQIIESHTAAIGALEGGAIASAGVKISAKIIQKETINESSASDFVRTETVSGNQSSRTVGEYVEKIKSGENIPPIEVRDINGQKYVINGHHRLEAAKITNTKLNFEKISDSSLKSYGYSNDNHVLQAAADATATRPKLNYKLIKKAIN